METMQFHISKMDSFLGLDLSNCIMADIKINTHIHTQQLWFDDGLWLKYVYVWCFLWFNINFKGFINIHKYANEIICTSDHGIKGLCLSFNSVPRFVIYDKQ